MPPGAGARAGDSSRRPPRLPHPRKRARSWIDPEDGWFDLSRFLEHPHGFLPLVVPITEPALGYGAVAGAVFLDPREEAGAEGWARPNITFARRAVDRGRERGLFARATRACGATAICRRWSAAGRWGSSSSCTASATIRALDDDPLDYRLDVDGDRGRGPAAPRRVATSGCGLRFAYARADGRLRRLRERHPRRRSRRRRRHARRAVADAALRLARQRVHADARHAERHERVASSTTSSAARRTSSSSSRC